MATVYSSCIHLFTRGAEIIFTPSLPIQIISGQCEKISCTIWDGSSRLYTIDQFPPLRSEKKKQHAKPRDLGYAQDKNGCGRPRIHRFTSSATREWRLNYLHFANNLSGHTGKEGNKSSGEPPLFFLHGFLIIYTVMVL